MWCLSPDRLARVYAYQVIVLDELARHRGQRRVHRRPADRRRPAGQAAHPGAGRDRRVRAGQDRRTVPARQAVPLPRRGGDHLARALRLPAAAPRQRRPGPAGDLRTRGRGRPPDLRRHRAGGTPPREIIRRLAADGVPSPTGRQRDLGHLDAVAGCCATRPTSAGSTSTAPSRSPTRGPAGAAGRSRDRAEDWITIAVPAIVDEQTFEAAGGSAATTAKWSPRRAEPGQWLLSGLVKCGVCGVGTNCHKMRGRNGTWHRYYYCRNHDPIRAGGARPALPRTQHPRRRPRRLRVRPGPRRAAAPRRADRRRTSRRRRAPRPPTTNCSPPSWPASTASSTPPTPNAAASSTSTRPGCSSCPSCSAAPPRSSTAATTSALRRDALTTQRQELTRDNQLRRRVHDFATRVLDRDRHTSTSTRNRPCSASSSKTSTSPAGTSRSGYGSPSTPNPKTNHHPPPEHCQVKTVCAPFVVTTGDSYRLRDHHARTDNIRKANRTGLP